MEEFFVVLVDFFALFEFVVFVKNGLMEEFSINYFYKNFCFLTSNALKSNFFLNLSCF
jgi:hypothetical protein